MSDDNYDMSLANFLRDALLVLVPEKVRNHIKSFYKSVASSDTQIQIESVIDIVAKYEVAHDLIPAEDIELFPEGKEPFTISLNNIMPTQAEIEDESDDEEQERAKRIKRNKMLSQNIRQQQESQQRMQQQLKQQLTPAVSSVSSTRTNSGPSSSKQVQNTINLPTLQQELAKCLASMKIKEDTKAFRD